MEASPLTLGSACPRKVAGKRCQRDGPKRECICRDFGVGLGWGVCVHPRMWIAKDGERIMTAEPYEINGALLARFIAACEELGLQVGISGASPYYADHGELIIIRRKEEES